MHLASVVVFLMFVCFSEQVQVTPFKILVFLPLASRYLDLDCQSSISSFSYAC